MTKTEMVEVIVLREHKYVFPVTIDTYDDMSQEEHDELIFDRAFDIYHHNQEQSITTVDYQVKILEKQP